MNLSNRLNVQCTSLGICYHRQRYLIANPLFFFSLSQAQMSPSDVAVEATNVLSQFSQVLATESDYGGYAGPAGSLILIGILILSLSPPLATKDQD